MGLSETQLAPDLIVLGRNLFRLRLSPHPDVFLQPADDLPPLASGNTLLFRHISSFNVPNLKTRCLERVSLLVMLIPRLATTLLVVAYTAIASSVARNPLNTLGHVSSPSIDTQSHRITAFSHFDLSFTAYHGRIKLTLEPNHDILSHAPEVRYLDADGNVVRTEPIDRLAHKVFKGEAWWQHVGL